MFEVLCLLPALSERGDVRHTVNVVLVLVVLVVLAVVLVVLLKNYWPSGCVQGKWRQFVLSSFLQLSFFASLFSSCCLPVSLCLWLHFQCPMSCVCVCVFARKRFFFSIIVSLTSVPDVLCISCNTPLLLCISQMCDSWKMAKGSCRILRGGPEGVRTHPFRIHNWPGTRRIRTC